MKRVGAFAGRWVVALLGLAILSVASLFVVGAFLTTYPILRLSPRDRRVKAALNAALAIAALAACFKPEPAEPVAGDETPS
jgi:heme A synthase